MNEEILSGMKNAKERGSSIDEAAQTFINAGYDEAEVKEAASLLSKGFAPLPIAKEEEGEAKPEGIAPKPEVKSKSASKALVVLLIILLILILGLAISFLLFREDVLSAIDAIFP